METLDIDGVTYQRVSSAARENGYTADYVGQLCRGGKINAKLVGRTWYVEKEAIGGHKRSKVRSNATKTKQSLIAELKVHTESNKSTPVPMHPLYSAPAYRTRLMAAEVRYETDNNSLIPRVRDAEGAQHQIPVQKSVDIISEEETPVEVAEPQKEEIKWNGTIVVAPVESDEEEQVQVEGQVAMAIHDAATSAVKNDDEDVPEESVFESVIVDASVPVERPVEFLTQDEKEDILGVSEEGAVETNIAYFGRLPVVLATLVTCAFLASATFMQSVWIYESGTPTRQPYMTTSYSASTPSNLATTILGK